MPLNALLKIDWGHQEWKTYQEVTAEIQMRGDGGLDQGGSSGDIEQWFESGSLLIVELILASGL